MRLGPHPKPDGGRDIWPRTQTEGGHGETKVAVSGTCHRPGTTSTHQATTRSRRAGRLLPGDLGKQHGPATLGPQTSSLASVGESGRAGPVSVALSQQPGDANPGPQAFPPGQPRGPGCQAGTGHLPGPLHPPRPGTAVLEDTGGEPRGRGGVRPRAAGVPPTTPQSADTTSCLLGCPGPDS